MKKKRNNKRKIEEEEDFFDEFEDEFYDESEEDSAKEKKGGFFSKLFEGGDDNEFDDEFDDEFEEEPKPVKKQNATSSPKKKHRKPPVVEEVEDEFDDEFDEEFEEEPKPVKKQKATPSPKKKPQKVVADEFEDDEEYDEDYEDDEIELSPQQKKIAMGVLGVLALLFVAWIMWPSGNKNNNNAQSPQQNVNAAANLDNLPEPTNAQGHADRAQAYFNIKQYDKSLEYLNKAIAIEPNYEDIHRNKGMLFSLTNRHDLAVPEFDLHLQGKPDDVIVYHWRGIAKFNTAQYAAAIADFSEVINRDEPKGEYYVYRSQAHNELGNKAEALADAKEAQKLGVELKPEYLEELQAE